MLRKILFLLLTSLTTFSQNAALHFDDTSNYVDLGSVTPIATKSIFTIECWIYVDDLTNVQGQNPIYGEYTNSTTGGLTANFLFIRDDGKLVFDQYLPPQSSLVSNATLAIKNWYHVAYIKDGTTEQMYINGVLDITRIGAVEPVVQREFAHIGSRKGAGATPRYFKGLIDEFRIWNVARTQQEIAAGMKSELQNSPSSLELYLKFNEGNSDNDNTALSNVLVDEANQYTATLTNFTKTGSTSNWKNGAPLRMYVNTNATGIGNGGNWENAFTDLGSALFYAQLGRGNEIWVAKGTYKPTQGSRFNSFIVSDSVKLYGGFEGTEDIDFNVVNRNFSLNETILSGDIGVERDSSDNVYHVIRTTNVTKETHVNGFTIEGGNANPSSLGISDRSGGGLLNLADDIGEQSIVTVSNCIFRKNFAATSGGGLASVGNAGGSASVLLRNNIFIGNRALAGAGLIIRDLDESMELEMVNLAIVSNRVLESGSGGGMNIVFNEIGSRSDSLINCTITGNLARFGAGVDLTCTGGCTSLNLNLVNTVITNNDAFQWNNPNDLRNSIETDGFVTLTYQNSLVYGNNSTANGNLAGTTDPIFVQATEPFSAPNLSADFRLLPCSPLINAGISSGAPPDDVFGRLRCDTPDIGTHEFKGSSSSTLIYVRQGANSGGSGTSWADAFTDIQSALSALGSCGGDSIWVSKGTYYPTTLTISRDVAFEFTQNTVLRGGFEGVEPTNYNLSLRDFSTNETILSGDIGVKSDSTDNSYTLIKLDRIAQQSELDGFILEKALADGSGSFFRSAGAGVGIWSRDVTIDLNIKNCTFRDMASASNGAGILNNSSNNGQGNIQIENTRFSNIQRGAIANIGSFTGSVSAEIRNTSIQGVESSRGALRNAAFETGNAILLCEGCVITGNKTGSSGAGLKNEQNDPTTDYAKASLINCTIVGNKSFSGAGLSNEGGTVFVTNSIFWNNDASFEPEAGISTTDGGTTTIKHSMVQGIADTSNGNIASTAPLFEENILGVNAPTAAGDFRLKLCSPMTDKGTNDSLNVSYTLDITGSTRIVNATEAAQATVDLGAYEFQAQSPPTFLNLTDDISTQTIIRAEALEASNEIIDPADVYYHGDNSVLLKPGFETQTNVVFMALLGAFTCPE